MSPRPRSSINAAPTYCYDSAKEKPIYSVSIVQCFQKSTVTCLHNTVPKINFQFQWLVTLYHNYKVQYQSANSISALSVLLVCNCTYCSPLFLFFFSKSIVSPITNRTFSSSPNFIWFLYLLMPVHSLPFYLLYHGIKHSKWRPTGLFRSAIFVQLRIKPPSVSHRSCLGLRFIGIITTTSTNVTFTWKIMILFSVQITLICFLSSLCILYNLHQALSKFKNVSTLIVIQALVLYSFPFIVLWYRNARRLQEILFVVIAVVVSGHKCP